MAIELGGSVFEITHDLVGDLFRAKNAGVTMNFIFHHFNAQLKAVGILSIMLSNSTSKIIEIV
jgi:hypothetical protein